MGTGERRVHLLETTIRDGGYEIDHQFTEEDVALVVSVLDDAGVEYIEVGYGQGVGAQLFAAATRPKARPVAGDLAHMRAARAAARRAKVGVLYVAGDNFCPIDYLDQVADAGMDFVRLAFMPADLSVANLRYVERARKLGLTVAINLMQTYLLPAKRVGELAAEAHRAGADWFYVVDSAGGMDAAEIQAYVRAVREASDVAVGLHAHNNMGCAVANSLAAVEAGATMVDSTLNGIGRATGNPPTEQLVLALQRRGHEAGIDLEPINAIVGMFRGLLESKGNSPLDFVSGAAMVHSRNVPAILTKVRELGLSPADFLVRVGREARIEGCLDRFVFPPEVFERAAQGCKGARVRSPAAALISAISGRLAGQADAGLARVCDDLALRVGRQHKRSVLHLVAPEVFPFDGPLPWQSEELVGVTMAWRSTPDISLPADRTPHHLLVDASLAGSTGLPPCKGSIFHGAWDDLWLDATRAMVEACVAAGAAQLWMPSQAGIAARVAERLRAAGLNPRPERPAGAVVVAAPGDGSDRWLSQLAAGDRVVLLDRGPGAREVAEAIRRAGAHALCPAIGAAIAGRLQSMLSLGRAAEAVAGGGQGASPWVEPLVMPGGGQAVVDLAAGAIVEAEPGRFAAVVKDVAEARARALVAGTGSL